MKNLLPTFATPVSADWVDYNGHLRDAYYFLIFSFATDVLMQTIGLDERGRAASGHTLYTLEAHINYLMEARLHDEVQVYTQILDRDHKRLHLVHHLLRPATSGLLAVSEQMLMNIDQQAGRSTEFAHPVRQRVNEFYDQHKHVSPPAWCGRTIQIRK